MSRYRSFISQRLFSDVSRFICPGPKPRFRAALPKLPVPGAAKHDVLNHWFRYADRSRPPANAGSHVRFGRGLPVNVLVTFVCSTAPHGAPEWTSAINPSVQPPITASRNGFRMSTPLPLPIGSSYTELPMIRCRRSFPEYDLSRRRNSGCVYPLPSPPANSLPPSMLSRNLDHV